MLEFHICQHCQHCHIIHTNNPNTTPYQKRICPCGHNKFHTHNNTLTSITTIIHHEYTKVLGKAHIYDRTHKLILPESTGLRPLFCYFISSNPFQSLRTDTNNKYCYCTEEYALIEWTNQNNKDTQLTPRSLRHINDFNHTRILYADPQFLQKLTETLERIKISHPNK